MQPNCSTATEIYTPLLLAYGNPLQLCLGKCKAVEDFVRPDNHRLNSFLLRSIKRSFLAQSV